VGATVRSCGRDYPSAEREARRLSFDGSTEHAVVEEAVTVFTRDAQLRRAADLGLARPARAFGGGGAIRILIAAADTRVGRRTERIAALVEQRRRAGDAAGRTASRTLRSARATRRAVVGTTGAELAGQAAADTGERAAEAAGAHTARALTTRTAVHGRPLHVPPGHSVPVVQGLPALVPATQRPELGQSAFAAQGLDAALLHVSHWHLEVKKPAGPACRRPPDRGASKYPCRRSCDSYRAPCAWRGGTSSSPCRSSPGTC
jgi:hypothetical protein